MCSDVVAGYLYSSSLLYTGVGDTDVPMFNLRMDGWSKIKHPTRHKKGHFGDVLPSLSLGLVLKKLHSTKLATQNQSDLS